MNFIQEAAMVEAFHFRNITRQWTRDGAPIVLLHEFRMGSREILVHHPEDDTFHRLQCQPYRGGFYATQGMPDEDIADATATSLSMLCPGWEIAHYRLDPVWWFLRSVDPLDAEPWALEEWERECARPYHPASDRAWAWADIRANETWAKRQSRVY